jgi:hypothetical protein
MLRTRPARTPGVLDHHRPGRDRRTRTLCRCKRWGGCPPTASLCEVGGVEDPRRGRRLVQARPARLTTKEKATIRGGGTPAGWSPARRAQIDREHGLIHTWTVTHAGAHDGGQLENLLDTGTVGSPVPPPRSASPILRTISCASPGWRAGQLPGSGPQRLKRPLASRCPTTYPALTPRTAPRLALRAQTHKKPGNSSPQSLRGRRTIQPTPRIAEAASRPTMRPWR